MPSQQNPLANRLPHHPNRLMGQSLLRATPVDEHRNNIKQCYKLDDVVHGMLQCGRAEISTTTTPCYPTGHKNKMLYLDASILSHFASWSAHRYCICPNSESYASRATMLLNRHICKAKRRILAHPEPSERNADCLEVGR